MNLQSQKELYEPQRKSQIHQLIHKQTHDIPATYSPNSPRKSSTPTTTATLNQALKDLIEKAITEQQFLQNPIIKD